MNLKNLDFFKLGPSMSLGVPSIQIYTDHRALWPSEIKFFLNFPFDHYRLDLDKFLIIHEGSGGWPDRLLLTDRLGHFKEYSKWVNHYPIPRGFDKKSYTVFDVGSDVGTTMFYFNVVHGLENFSFCDTDPEAYKLCLLNSRLNNWNIYEAFNEPFNPSVMLVDDYDLLKIDIDGGESALIDYDLNIPTCIEVHGSDMIQAFKKKGFKRVENLSHRGSVFDQVWIMNNYHLWGLEGEVIDEDYPGGLGIEDKPGFFNKLYRAIVKVYG